MLKAVGEDTGRVPHVTREVGGQDAVDDGARGTAVEPGRDGGSEPLHLPPGEGEAVVGTTQPGEQGDGLVVVPAAGGVLGAARLSLAFNVAGHSTC